MTQFNLGYRIEAKDATRSTLASALSGVTRFARLASKPITIPLRVGRKGLSLLRDINLGLRPLVSAIDNVIDRGARLEVVSKSFQSLTGKNAAQARRLAKELVVAASGTIKLSKAMEIANRALGSGIDLSQLTIAIEFISKKAITTGLNAEQALTKVITGLSRGSTLFLDDFGILVDGIDGVRRAFDKVKGASAFDSLGPAGQKAEIIRAAIAEMVVQMGKIGVTGNETIFVFQGIKNQISDVLDKLVGSVSRSKSLNESLKAIRETLSGITEFLDNGGSFLDVFFGKKGGKSGGLFGILKAGMLDVAEALGKAVLVHLLKAVISLLELLKGVNIFEASLTLLKDAFKNLNVKDLFKDVKLFDIVTKSLDIVAVAIDKLREVMTPFIDKINGLVHAIRSLPIFGGDGGGAQSGGPGTDVGGPSIGRSLGLQSVAAAGVGLSVARAAKIAAAKKAATEAGLKASEDTFFTVAKKTAEAGKSKEEVKKIAFAAERKVREKAEAATLKRLLGKKAGKSGSVVAEGLIEKQVTKIAKREAKKASRGLLSKTARLPFQAGKAAVTLPAKAAIGTVKGLFGGAKFLGSFALRKISPALIIADFLQSSFTFGKGLLELRALNKENDADEGVKFSRKRLAQTRRAKAAREAKKKEANKPLLPDKLETFLPVTPSGGAAPKPIAGIRPVGGSLQVVLANLLPGLVLGATPPAANSKGPITKLPPGQDPVEALKAKLGLSAEDVRTLDSFRGSRLELFRTRDIFDAKTASTKRILDTNIPPRFLASDFDVARKERDRLLKLANAAQSNPAPPRSKPAPKLAPKPGTPPATSQPATTQPATSKPGAIDRLKKALEKLENSGGGQSRASKKIDQFLTEFPPASKSKDKPLTLDLIPATLTDRGRRIQKRKLNLLNRELRSIKRETGVIARQAKRDAISQAGEEVRRQRDLGFKIDRRQLERQIFDRLVRERTARQSERIGEIDKEISSTGPRRQKTEGLVPTALRDIVNTNKRAAERVEKAIEKLTASMDRGIAALAGPERKIAAAGGRRT